MGQTQEQVIAPYYYKCFGDKVVCLLEGPFRAAAIPNRGAQQGFQVETTFKRRPEVGTGDSQAKVREDEEGK